MKIGRKILHLEKCEYGMMMKKKKKKKRLWVFIVKNFINTL